MAVDTVQSEPLSGEFPLTGNLTEKFRPLHRNPRLHHHNVGIREWILSDLRSIIPCFRRDPA